MRAALREAPDHYAMLDSRLVARLAGFLYCAAGLIACVLLAIDPPTGAIGGAGWLPAVATVLLGFAFGAAMLASTRPLPPVVLFAVALSGPLMLGTLQWLAGRQSSYAELLILSAVWCAVVLPARRLAVAVAAQTVVVFLPIATHDWASSDMLSERVATLGVLWALGLVCFIHATRMRSVRRSLHAKAAAADSLARVDALTGLGNRRALDEALVTRAALVARTGQPLSALVGDLDGFKQINDRFGHHAGDRLLGQVAFAMRDVVRAPDSCFRWGGDEFVVLLHDVALAEAEEIAARVAAAVAERCATPAGRPVTVTFGAAEHVAGQPGTRLLAIADAALLAAKAGARSG
ncbi:MAG TPA: GGDEF domain-containing protein [Baekduia sp.]|nr:GGDEF domain-containing protein [Baekduia sp.]